MIAAASQACSPSVRPGSPSVSTPSTPSTATAQPFARVAAAPRLPRAITLAETRPPDFDVSELALPAGCEVTDNTDTLAAYAQNTLQAYPSTVFGLVDLATGERRIVLPQPVGHERSFDAFTPVLSDDWLAWEEVSPGEANAMRSAQWRLYAAPIDRARLTIGQPVLVDEGTTDCRLRPHYGVEGSLLCWSANVVSRTHQESTTTSGAILTLDLATGERRTLRRGNRLVPALKTSGPNVVAVEGPDAHAPSSNCRILVIDSRSGAVVRTQDAGSRDRPAHFADFANDWIAWTPFAGPGSQWPDLYVGLPDGSVALAGTASIDPTFFGRYLAYESIGASSTTGGSRSASREIWGADTVRPDERFRILRTSGDEGWWQTSRAGLTSSTLVLWNDLGPWVGDPARAATLVRVYRARAEPK